MPPSPGGEAFSCYDCYKAFVKNEFRSAHKKLHFHATIGTKHLPKMSFEVLKRNHILMQQLGQSIWQKRILKYSEEISNYVFSFIFSLNS